MEKRGNSIDSSLGCHNLENQGVVDYCFLCGGGFSNVPFIIIFPSEYIISCLDVSIQQCLSCIPIVRPCCSSVIYTQIGIWVFIYQMFWRPIMEFFLSCPRMFWWYAHLGGGQMKSTCSIFNYWKKHLWANYMIVNAVSRDCSISLQATVQVWNRLSRLLTIPNLTRYGQKPHSDIPLFVDIKKGIILFWQIKLMCRVCMMWQGCPGIADTGIVKSCMKVELVDLDSPPRCGNQQDGKVYSMDDSASTTEPAEEGISQARAMSSEQSSTCYVGKHRHSPSRSAGRWYLLDVLFVNAIAYDSCSFRKRAISPQM